MSREESDAFLADMAERKAGVAPALRKRLLAFLPEQKRARTKKPRTLQQLLQRAEELEQDEQKRLKEKARKKHIAEMKELAAREEQAWQEVDQLLDHGRRIASVYDEATARLKKLEQLSEFKRTEHIFQMRVRAMTEKYTKRQALIRRWKKQGWV
jgi:1,6-anhydro-N-acetylmuramate kinase